MKYAAPKTSPIANGLILAVSTVVNTVKISMKYGAHSPKSVKMNVTAAETGMKLANVIVVIKIQTPSATPRTVKSAVKTTGAMD